MYYVSSYQLKDKKAVKYQEWLLSDDAKGIFADIQEETGWRYMDTFWVIMGFGEFACEDWWEVPDWASFEKTRTAESLSRLFARYSELDCTDNARPSSTRMLRTTRDVRVFE
jgi:hypothetical protein